MRVEFRSVRVAGFLGPLLLCAIGTACFETPGGDVPQADVVDAADVPADDGDVPDLAIPDEASLAQDTATEHSDEVGEESWDDSGGLEVGEDVPGCTPYFRDTDGDGFGVTGDSKCLPSPAAPYTALWSGDCDDANTAITIGDCANGFVNPVCTGQGADARVVALPDGGSALLWNGPEIRMQRFDALGQTLGVPRTVATDPTDRCDTPFLAVLLGTGNLAVAWTNGSYNACFGQPDCAVPPGPDGWGLGVAVRVVPLDGGQPGPAVQVNTQGQGHQKVVAVVALVDGFQVFWTSELPLPDSQPSRSRTLLFRRFSAAGVPQGEPVDLALDTDVVAGWPDGTFVTLGYANWWDSLPWTVQRHAADGSKVGDPIPVQSAVYRADPVGARILTLRDGAFAINTSWYEDMEPWRTNRLQVVLADNTCVSSTPWGEWGGWVEDVALAPDGGFVIGYRMMLPTAPFGQTSLYRVSAEGSPLGEWTYKYSMCGPSTPLYPCYEGGEQAWRLAVLADGTVALAHFPVPGIGMMRVAPEDLLPVP